MTTKGKTKTLVISPPKFETAAFKIRGRVPLVMNKFNKVDFDKMKNNQETGQVSRGKKTREPKDFHSRFEQSIHRSHAGWAGIPALAFRAGMISVCRLVGFKMTIAKLAIFIEPDDFEDDGTPLVRITKGEPREVIHYVTNSNRSTDLRARAMWDPGWEATVTIRWDADQYALQDVTNLLYRVGMQAGVLGGRPDSKNSIGMGWGLFDITGE